MVDSPLQDMTGFLENWLARTDWEPGQLIRFLQGYDIPALGHEDEPYQWILRGLPRGRKRHPTRKKLAERLASVLSAAPDVERPGKRPEEVLYNLLMLCAGVYSADQLGQRLFEMFERRALQGKHRGLDLRIALQYALASNQLDNRLEPDWYSMLGKGRHEYLKGNEYDGFGGILMMPPSANDRGKPAYDSIGKALRLMAEHLEQRLDRRPKFQKLLDRVERVYPLGDAWNLDFIRQAHKNDWPVWAVDSLRNLSFTAKVNPGELEEACVWHYALACVPENLGYQVLESLCCGNVLRVRMEEETSSFVHLIAPKIERVRRENPHPSERSAVDSAAQSKAEHEYDARMRLATMIIACRAQLHKGLQRRPLDCELLHRMLSVCAEHSVLKVDSDGPIRYSIVPDLQEVDRNTQINADPILVKEAISNLLDNAVKYSFANSVMSITLGLKNKNNLQVSVRNTGVRIPQEEVRHRIAGEWREIEAEMTAGEGTRIGLWIVNSIMESHNGKLAIRQNRDGLTEFQLLFPIL